jgi:hypothetical protein
MSGRKPRRERVAEVRYGNIFLPKIEIGRALPTLVLPDRPWYEAPMQCLERLKGRRPSKDDLQRELAEPEYRSLTIEYRRWLVPRYLLETGYGWTEVFGEANKILAGDGKVDDETIEKAYLRVNKDLPAEMRRSDTTHRRRKPRKL